MEIKFNLTEEDYLKFTMFHIKNSKTHNRALKTQRLMTPLLLIIMSYLFSLFDTTYFKVLLIISLVVSVLWILFYPKYFYSYIIRNTKKMLKEGKNDGLIGEHQWIMSEEGLADKTSNGESKVNWSGIKSLQEDKDYFYLYNSAISAYVLPKRATKNVEDVRKYLLSHIKS